MNILAFGASTSKKSINKQFATFVANQIKENTIDVLDLNDFPLPLFSVDLEAESGHPAIINDFIKKLESADLIVISNASKVLRSLSESFYTRTTSNNFRNFIDIDKFRHFT